MSKFLVESRYEKRPRSGYTQWVYMSSDSRKLVFRVFDQVRHKAICTVTEDGWRLEILDFERSGIVLSD